MTTKEPIAIPAGGATFSFDAAYGIETEWDFMWVQASEDGTNWKTLTNANTTCTHDGSWIGGEYGFPEDLCAAGIGGLTDYNANFPEPDTQTFDLGAFAGKNVWLRLWYMTDWGTTYEGPFVDNVKVMAGETVLFADDAEYGDAKWVYAAPWQRSSGMQTFGQRFYLQWRNTSRTGGYDSSLGESKLALRSGGHRLDRLVQQRFLRRQRNRRLPDRLPELRPEGHAARRRLASGPAA